MKQKKNHLSSRQVEKILVEAGIHPTAQRIAIGRYLFCEADHPTVDRIKEWADRNFPKMSRATVYNTVKKLVEGGVLSEFKFSHSDAAIYDRNTSVHHHFLDEKTGELIDIAPEEVKVELQLKTRLEVKGISVFLRGRRCSSPPSESRSD